MLRQAIICATLGLTVLLVATGCEKSYVYTVKEGDTIKSIASKVYGDDSLSTEIRDANKGVRNRDLEPGMELTIPDVKGVEPMHVTEK